MYSFLAFHDLDLEHRIIPNYEKPQAEVCKNAAENIKNSRSLDLFAAVSGDRSYELAQPSLVLYWSDPFPSRIPIVLESSQTSVLLETPYMNGYMHRITESCSFAARL